MKKLLLAFLMLSTMSVCAQNYKNDGKPYYFYCEMTAQMNLSGKLRLTLEWNKNRAPEQLRDENGEKIEFASVVDMMNYMSKRGWDMNQTYSYGNVVRFLFRKLVTTDEEAKDGLIFKSDKE